MFPRIIVNTDAIAHNAHLVTELCAQHGINVCAITKVFGAEPRLARLLLENGAKSLGDSRLDDLEKLADIDCTKVLVRSPQLSDVRRTVHVADVSLNTEPVVLRALDTACEQEGVESHGVVLVYDLGDLREGFVKRDELVAAAQLVCELPHLRLAGVAANLNCLSFVRPDRAKMEELVSVAEEVEREYGVSGLEVAGGNSSNLRMMLAGEMPEGVNALRLGEALCFGRERDGYKQLPGSRDDAFVFQTEIIELKEKPSMPWGVLGKDSLGRVHEFEDEGLRKRAIVALGTHDCEPKALRPIDPGARVVGASCDHTVVDVTDSQKNWQVGDVLEFKCDYHAVSRSFTNPCVEKVYR